MAASHTDLPLKFRMFVARFAFGLELAPAALCSPSGELVVCSSGQREPATTALGPRGTPRSAPFTWHRCWSPLQAPDQTLCRARHWLRIASKSATNHRVELA